MRGAYATLVLISLTVGALLLVGKVHEIFACALLLTCIFGANAVHERELASAERIKIAEAKALAQLTSGK